MECRSDGDYAGRPLAISWQGQRLVVEKVLDAWRAPAGKCYRVSTLDGQIFELCYSEFDDAWSVVNEAPSVVNEAPSIVEQAKHRIQ